MAEMNFYKYPTQVVAMFDYGKGDALLKTSVYNVIYKGLNKVCAQFLDGFDEGTKGWHSFFKKPVEIERYYLIDPAEAAGWKKRYKADQKRLNDNYKELVKELKKKKLSPLALRAEIEKELAKRPSLRQRVMNPIQEKEIEFSYNRYMEGQSIRFNETTAHQDFERLSTAVSNLRTAFLTVKGAFPSSLIDYDFAFAGLLNRDSLLTEIDAAISVSREGWANAISALTTGNTSTGEALTRQEAKRVVSRWIGTLRRLRSKCLVLVEAINAAAPKLSLSKDLMSTHVANTAKKETVNMGHREFMYWSATYMDKGDSGTHILAEAFKANGMERQMWADDFFMQSERNSGFWISNKDKLDYERWFAHLGMSYNWTSDIKKEDYFLSAKAGVPKQKLFDIALSYVISPTNREHTL